MNGRYHCGVIVQCVDGVAHWAKIVQMAASMRAGLWRIIIPSQQRRGGTGMTQIWISGWVHRVLTAFFWPQKKATWLMPSTGQSSYQENYREFRRKSQEERERKHDKIKSDQEKWEDPWMFQFRLHDDCQWWMTLKTVSASEEIDLERPKPGKKHKYS